MGGPRAKRADALAGDAERGDGKATTDQRTHTDLYRGTEMRRM
jgi:hypothetical protein